MRKKRLVLNTATALLNQIISLVCGFILPRQILLAYGSDINGLVSSITQFLGFVTFLDMGVGAVVQSTLYKPIAEKDEDSISRIIIAANKFFRKIAAILIAYTLFLMFFFPTFVDSGNGFVSTAILVLAISISSIGQYLFGITKQLLLNADQKSYAQLIPQSVVTILNIIVSVILISGGASINLVKLVSAAVFLIRPLWMSIYVKKNYNIDYKIELKKDPLEQKWNAMAQHVATFVADKTDIMILTLFSTLTNVSIYYVYHLVVNGLYQTFGVVTSSLQSFFGDMYAKNEMDKLRNTYGVFEWAIHTGLVFIFACTEVLILPFVEVYTNGVNDANYIVPAFAAVITIAFAGSCLRSFYNILIKSVGHYKQTQMSAIIEALLNLIISVALVYKFGLIGVAIGTLVSMFYRSIHLKIYTDLKILNQSVLPFIKQCMIDLVLFILIIFTTNKFSLNAISYLAWIILALKVVAVALVLIIVINMIFYRKNIFVMIKMIRPRK